MLIIRNTRSYMNGAGTNPDPHVVAYAGAQVKKMLEITKKLGGVNFGETIIFVLDDVFNRVWCF